MKKLILLVAAVFTVSFAQAQGGIKLGLKAGANLASFSGEDADDAKNKFGFHVGGFLDYGISEMVSIRPEVLYSMKGAKYKEDGDEGSFNLNYIDVPVLVRINADQLFFEFGPTLSFLVKSEAEMGDFKVDMGDAMKKTDFGYAAGLGYNFTEKVGLGLRYNGGLSNIFEDEDNGKLRNSVFMLSLAYTIK
ncbi:outer membrane beta-barrel protein [Nibribacter ruber]|uniref:Outer membrane beta-barrel protein n=1 Tax=Nibribacter ruber TaxID=2698458 RepID=A0A6P1NZM9_9BACT|nr:porin family protein [Nibribacter ruber]QHL87739.1 outer membrane beta-barrel protein [Nibribacter ruber]